MAVICFVSSVGHCFVLMPAPASLCCLLGVGVVVAAGDVFDPLAPVGEFCGACGLLLFFCLDVALVLGSCSPPSVCI